MASKTGKRRASSRPRIDNIPKELRKKKKTFLPEWDRTQWMTFGAIVVIVIIAVVALVAWINRTPPIEGSYPIAVNVGTSTNTRYYQVGNLTGPVEGYAVSEEAVSSSIAAVDYVQSFTALDENSIVPKYTVSAVDNEAEAESSKVSQWISILIGEGSKSGSVTIDDKTMYYVYYPSIVAATEATDDEPATEQRSEEYFMFYVPAGSRAIVINLLPITGQTEADFVGVDPLIEFAEKVYRTIK